MNPWMPRTLARGEGGQITTEGGALIGTAGDWAIQTYGDDRPFLTARSCDIARIWRSAGVQRVVVRPRQPAGATIAGTVKLLDAARLNLGDLTITGIAGLEGAADG